MRKLNTTPKHDGFYMPAEFEEHDGTYMIWPERTDNWRYGAKYAQHVFVQIAAVIGKYENTTMLVNSSQYKNARAVLPEYVRVLEMSNNDAWARDTGATFVKNNAGELRGIDWEFNAWGGLQNGLYFPWDKDSQIAQKMCELEYADVYHVDNFVLEGGAIHVDGNGSVMATEACLLDEGRNPHLDKETVEQILQKYLNVEKVIWLKHGIHLDETNEHIDNICCFVKPGVVTLAWTDDTNDPQYQFSKDCYDILSSITDSKGRKLNIHKIHIPSPVIISKEESCGVDSVSGTKPRAAGDRLAASYINYYVCNGAVIVPAFNDPMDGQAKETLKDLYPDRDIIQIYSREILLGGGNIHCITQQVPKREIT
ncbi:MAG: agmatine deiminase [Spirochaetaceae bacterium]|jgi:agmatine deiminase|nr:agmatine deiminase [Spirochaetaceae bacterium]